MTALLRPRAGPGTRDPKARTPALVLGAVAVLVALTATLMQPEHHLGLSVPEVVGLVSRVVAVGASAGVLGCLLLCLCQPSGGGPDRELLASASGWAAVWVGALGVGFAVELASPASIAARRAVGPDAGDVSVRLRWLVVGILLAALVRVLCPAVRRRADVGTVSAVTVAGLLVATGTGHGGSALSPTLASMALLAHVLAASAWTGGLLALVVHGRGTESADAGAATARAYSRIALVCYFVLAGSGLLGLLDRTGLGGLLDSHSYLAVVLAKTGLLLLLGLLGASQRRSGLARLGSGDRAGFLLLAVSELVLMAAAIGLGVTLAHTAA